MNKNLVKISKFLSLVLRHQPEYIGICLDQKGWVSVDVLLKAAMDHGVVITPETFLNVVHTNDKQRFSLSDDGQRVRANQGHSLKVDLDLVEVNPPAKLYHGTVGSALSGIRSEGITKMKRHHVHLSETIATATTVGSRRGVAVILSIDSQAMVKDGFKFFLSQNGVWLTECVPYVYVKE